MKLTKRTIDALQPKDRDFTIWDQELRGFGCRIHPSGRRTFVFKYRVGGGRRAAQRKLLLGAYGAITVDQARSLARQAQAEIVKGGDPNRHFDGVGHVWERVREKAGLENVRLHDLRHTFASKGVGLGVGLQLIGSLLGHKNPTTTAKYAHLAADPLRAANDRIADRLEVELSGGQHANGYKRRGMVSGLEPANDDVGTDGKLASGPS